MLCSVEKTPDMYINAFTTFPTHNLYIPSFPLRDEGLSGFRLICSVLDWDEVR